MVAPRRDEQFGRERKSRPDLMVPKVAASLGSFSAVGAGKVCFRVVWFSATEKTLIPPGVCFCYARRLVPHASAPLFSSIDDITECSVRWRTDGPAQIVLNKQTLALDGLAGAPLC
jgi:hypothetical protein